MIVSVRVNTRASIFPRVLVRKAGLTVTVMNELRFHRTIDRVDRFIALTEWCEHHKDRLCDILFRLVKHWEDDNKLLLRLKRDVFNSRITKLKFGQIIPYLECHEVHQDERKLILKWFECQNERQLIMRNGQHWLEEEYQEKRSVMQQKLAHKDVENALLLSSVRLYPKLKSYRRVPLEANMTRERKTTNVFYRYLSRMSMKTSPFSFFTNISSARLSDHANSLYFATGNQTPVSACSVNLALINRWIDLLQKHPEIRKQLPVQATPVMWLSDDRIHFIVRSNREGFVKKLVHSEESIISMRRTTSLDSILRLVRSPIKYEDFVEVLCSSANVPMEKAEQVAEQLLSTGVIECRIPLPEMEPDPLCWLIDYLEQLTVKQVSSFISIMQEMRYVMKQFPEQPFEERYAGLLLLQRKSEELFEDLGAREESSWENYLIYEDVIRPENHDVIYEKPFQSAVRDLAALFQILPLVDENIYHRESIKYFYRRQYQSRKIPLLEFFQAYTTAVGQDSIYDENRSPFFAFNPFQLKQLDEISELTMEWYDWIYSNRDRELNLDGERVRGLSERIPALFRRGTNMTVFCQPVVLGEGQAGIVVNNIYRGPLAPFVRYRESLPMLARDLDQAIVPGKQEQELDADIIGSFGLNANLHTPVTPLTIAYGQASPVDDKALRLTDLYIELDHTGELVLVTSDGQKIRTLDMGMMHRSFHPALYRFLTHLYQSEYMPLVDTDLALFAESQRSTIRQEEQVRMGNAVLARKRWFIGKDLIPQIEPGESDFDYFHRLRKWQQQHRLPGEAFVRARHVEEAYAGQLRPDHNEATLGKGRPGTEFKPQYVDFDNYISVNLFAKMAKEAHHVIILEEAFPSREDWNQMGQDYVVEWVIELSDDERYDFRRLGGQ